MWPIKRAFFPIESVELNKDNQICHQTDYKTAQQIVVDSEETIGAKLHI